MMARSIARVTMSNTDSEPRRLALIALDSADEPGQYESHLVMDSQKVLE